MTHGHIDYTIEDEQHAGPLGSWSTPDFHSYEFRLHYTIEPGSKVRLESDYGQPYAMFGTISCRKINGEQPPDFIAARALRWFEELLNRDTELYHRLHEAALADADKRSPGMPEDAMSTDSRV